AELGRIEVDGALPTNLAVERMQELGLVELEAHTSEPHTHKQVFNRCHDPLRRSSDYPGHGDHMIYFTEKGRKRAEDIIRRHRLAERLFMQNFHGEDVHEGAGDAMKVAAVS